jgi:predicted GIY-YIG superfamily endonuclease
MDHIYILKLKEGKYYIGKTKNIEKRWNEHLIGEGSGWTKKYKPVLLMKIIVSTSHFDEDKYVKEYMAKYGINNVRGGTYSNIELDDNSISVLEKEIRHSKNLCTRCGRDTHFIKDCYEVVEKRLIQHVDGMDNGTLTYRQNFEGVEIATIDNYFQMCKVNIKSENPKDIDKKKLFKIYD